MLSSKMRAGHDPQAQAEDPRERLHRGPRRPQVRGRGRLPPGGRGTAGSWWVAARAERHHHREARGEEAAQGRPRPTCSSEPRQLALPAVVALPPLLASPCLGPPLPGARTWWWGSGSRADTSDSWLSTPAPPHFLSQVLRRGGGQWGRSHRGAARGGALRRKVEGGHLHHYTASLWAGRERAGRSGCQASVTWAACLLPPHLLTAPPATHCPAVQAGAGRNGRHPPGL